MRKSELVLRLSQRLPHLSLAEINTNADLIIEAICEALYKQQRVDLRNFGSFTLRYRSAHKTHNPKTGATLLSTPTYRARFKPSKKLRDIVNSS